MDNSLIHLSRQYYFDLKHYFSLGDRREDKFKQEGCLYKYAYELCIQLKKNILTFMGDGGSQGVEIFIKDIRGLFKTIFLLFEQLPAGKTK